MDWGRLAQGVAGGVGGYMNPQQQQPQQGGVAGAQQGGSAIAKILMDYRRRQAGRKGMPNLPGQSTDVTTPSDMPLDTGGGMYDAPAPPMPPQAPGQPFADGGVVNQPTMALLGDDGPEMVVPLHDRPENKVHPSMRMDYRR